MASHTHSPHTPPPGPNGPHGTPAGSGASHGSRRAGSPGAAKPARSVTTLLRDLSREVATLVRKESTLAQAELREKLSQAGSGAAELGSGALITFAGALILLQALVLLLAPLLGSLWLSSVVVGGVTLLVGVILLARARSNLRAGNLAPERTVESLRRDAELVREAPAHARADGTHRTGPTPTGRTWEDGR